MMSKNLPALPTQECQSLSGALLAPTSNLLDQECLLQQLSLCPLAMTNTCNESVSQAQT